ncbi:related to amino-terminal amidase [Fusarium torulosum]|uniref:Related to amino-terminal amidase n=1 Tax=Fusarium torulosum TaxID=33205 RepID=A0AAE8MG42_9HYPO|nr:related to amino-terminal amidase [Fusarium torulosum]
MRIGCLQFAPQVGDVDNNLNRADAVLSRANPDDLDVLVLPELAFSGYNFKSLQDITPFLEPSGSGITSLWARTIALKYNCVVTVGYPEKVDVSPKWPTGPEYYNSVIVVNGDGETIANYRKSFLYQTDETWALEGNRGFYDGFIPGLGNTSIGICMDINPYKFEAPWHAFEFAFHILEVESNLVIVSMAWMTREDPRRFTRMPNEPDMETLTYWVTRLEPLIRSDNQDEIIVVFCNRCGNEDEVLYAGTSAVVGIQDGEVKVYGLLGRGEKELLVVDTNNSPYAKLVYRPETGGSGMEAPGHLEQANKPNDNDKKKSDSKTAPSEKPNSQPSNSKSETSSGKDKPKSPSAPLPPPPQLPDDFTVNSPTGSTKKRHPPDITIPKEQAVPRYNSARSPGNDSLNIPTPSAPSPTPMALRPRLIIPESPPILPHQYPPDHPISAASLRSERSIRSIESVKSDQSEASTRTIRTNPRPPEESTPYPDSGAPLSGYPANFFPSDKVIYGGEVTIDSAGPFSPNTPFEDISPISPESYYWRPTDHMMRTPLSAGGWTPGTPIGRRAEPFPWPAITGKAYPTNQSSTKDRAKDNATPKDLRQLNSQSPQSNSSSNRTAKSEKSTRSGSSVNSKGKVQRTIKENQSFERPYSPKSRNASRSRPHERSGSALGDRETSAAISIHLEGISLRAESASRTRAGSASGTPVGERVQSPQSRNGSRTRLGEAVSLQPEQHMIRIAASPSILKEDQRNQYQSLSRVAHHHRSNSFASTRTPVPDDDRSNTPKSAINVARPASRAASRGRTPGPKVSPTNGAVVPVLPAAERTSSADSTRNDRLHSRIHQNGTGSRQSRTGRNPSANNGRRKSDEGTTGQFERVEAILCPSCPVHGRRSSSGEEPNVGAPAPVPQSPPQPSPIPRPASSTGLAQHLQPEQLEPRRASSGDTIQLTIDQSIPDLSNVTQSSSQNEAAEASDCGSFAETLQTISTPGRSPATPSFNPSTPKAIILNTNDLEVEPLFNGSLDDPGKTPTSRCAEVAPQSTSSVSPKSVA